VEAHCVENRRGGRGADRAASHRAHSGQRGVPVVGDRRPLTRGQGCRREGSRPSVHDAPRAVRQRPAGRHGAGHSQSAPCRPCPHVHRGGRPDAAREAGRRHRGRGRTTAPGGGGRVGADPGGPPPCTQPDHGASPSGHRAGHAGPRGRDDRHRDVLQTRALATFMLWDTAASPRSWEQTSRENTSYPSYADEDCYVIARTLGSLSVPTMRLKTYSRGTQPSWLNPFQAGVVEVDRADPLERQLQPGGAGAMRRSRCSAPDATVTRSRRRPQLSASPISAVGSLPGWSRPSWRGASSRATYRGRGP